MPTYEYECQSCHQRVEAVQGFSDAALTTCEHCGSELRKVFSAVGIVFKGSGFYKTDSRGARTSTKTAKTAPTQTTPAGETSASATPSPSPTSSTTD